MGLREQIDAAQDLKRELVSVPEWGCDVYVRTMTGSERDAFEQSLAGKDGQRDLTNLRARLLVKTLVDEAGVRAYGDDEAHWLGGKAAAVLDRLFEVAQRLNGLGAAQGEIEKN